MAEATHHGNSEFFLVQLGGLVIACVWAAFAYGMLMLIDKVTTCEGDR